MSDVVKLDYTCDACCAVEPVWRYAVPEGTSALALQDRLTGEIVEPWRLAHGVGLCDECRGILERLGRLSPELPLRFASRMVHLHPRVRGVPAAQRAFAKKGMVLMWRRLLPLMTTPPVRHRRGDHPLDGLMILMPGADDPRPSTN